MECEVRKSEERKGEIAEVYELLQRSGMFVESKKKKLNQAPEERYVNM